MLVIQRKTGQVIWIGDVPICIKEVDRGQVSVVIDPPADIEILRAELVSKIPTPNPKYKRTVPRDYCGSLQGITRLAVVPGAPKSV